MYVYSKISCFIAFAAIRFTAWGIFCGCFGLLRKHWGEYMVAMSCDDMNKFLFDSVVIASPIHKFFISVAIDSA